MRYFYDPFFDLNYNDWLLYNPFDNVVLDFNMILDLSCTSILYLRHDLFNYLLNLYDLRYFDYLFYDLLHINWDFNYPFNNLLNWNKFFNNNFNSLVLNLNMVDYSFDFYYFFNLNYSFNILFDLYYLFDFPD